MGVTNISGPLVVASTDQDAGPSVFYGGPAFLLDPRIGYAGGGATGSPPVWGWGGSDFLVIKQVPATLAANNLATGAVGAGGGVIPAAAPSTGITAATIGGKASLVIDGAQTGIGFGQPAAVRAYDPRQAVSRNVRVTGTAGDTGTVTVRGFDLYNQPMTEVITANGATVVLGKKAFKAVWSCTYSTNSTGISVGTGDLYGMPLFVAGPAANVLSLNTVYWNNAVYSGTTNFVPGDTTSPATGTTGDVRGTFALTGLTQAASNGTAELVITQFLAPWNLGPTAGLPATTAYQGMFGVPQYAG